MRPRPLHTIHLPPAWAVTLLILTAVCPTSHPSDEKEFSFPRNISAGSLGSLLGHHHGQGTESDPHVTEPLIGAIPEARLEVEREVRREGVPAWVGPGPHGRLQDCEQASLSSVLLLPQRELPPSAPPAGITRSKSKHELKLLEKIPENAEATVVLVGTWGASWGWASWRPACLGAAPGLGARRWPVLCPCP